MKHIAFFITHKTLTKEHLELTLWSIFQQSVDSKHKFDKLYIYNSHEDELSYDEIFDVISEFRINDFFEKIEIFPYNKNTHKSLGGDISAIRDYVMTNYSLDDRVLLLKSDCLLSNNFFSDIFKLPKDQYVFFTAPFVCAKKRVENIEIMTYATREKYVRSDDITFFVEDKTNSSDNDFKNRTDVDILDESIKFTSCEVITDFSCHLISVGLFPKISIEHQSWGGVKFYNLVSDHIGTENSFVIHKFHDIISENRNTDREGPVKQWLDS